MLGAGDRMISDLVDTLMTGEKAGGNGISGADPLAMGPSPMGAMGAALKGSGAGLGRAGSGITGELELAASRLRPTVPPPGGPGMADPIRTAQMEAAGARLPPSVGGSLDFSTAVRPMAQSIGDEVAPSVVRGAIPPQAPRLPGPVSRPGAISGDPSLPPVVPQEMDAGALLPEDLLSGLGGESATGSAPMSAFPSAPSPRIDPEKVAAAGLGGLATGVGGMAALMPTIKKLRARLGLAEAPGGQVIGGESEVEPQAIPPPAAKRAR